VLVVVEAVVKGFGLYRPQELRDLWVNGGGVQTGGLLVFLLFLVW
jgi:hypothetical protein